MVAKDRFVNISNLKLVSQFYLIKKNLLYFILEESREAKHLKKKKLVQLKVLQKFIELQKDITKSKIKVNLNLTAKTKHE